MQQFPLKLGKRLETRKEEGSFRALKASENVVHLVDFSSNDYLGFNRKRVIFDRTSDIILEEGMVMNGAGGSRLLSGNHLLYPRAEKVVARFHKASAAVIYNSGYDANIGLFSAVLQRGDIVFYDELIHASIRDGMKMSAARDYKFRHNDLDDLKEKYLRLKEGRAGEVYVVTESVFSMDGDQPDLHSLVDFAKEHNILLIVDEAHAVGVFGKGLVAENELEKNVFARIVTFGKALGVHGAAVLGTKMLQDYLINFSRSLIYSTALPPHSVASILSAYEHLEIADEIKVLEDRIFFFRKELSRLNLESDFLTSYSAIQSYLLPGNQKVKKVSGELRKEGYDVKPILSPTVPAGKERLRFCLHSYNSEEEISKVLRLLATFV